MGEPPFRQLHILQRASAMTPFDPARQAWVPARSSRHSSGDAREMGTRAESGATIMVFRRNETGGVLLIRHTCETQEMGKTIEEK